MDSRALEVAKCVANDYMQEQSKQPEYIDRGVVNGAIEAAIEAYEDALPVRCQHEPYQGSCAHCGVQFANGRPIPEAPEGGE